MCPGKSQATSRTPLKHIYYGCWILIIDWFTLKLGHIKICFCSAVPLTNVHNNKMEQKIGLGKYRTMHLGG